MAGFSGSYRAQMEATNELRAASADFADSMSTASSNADWTKGFLDELNSGSAGSELGEWGDMLDGDFVPGGAAADLGEMGGYSGGLAGAVPESLADSEALALGAAVALDVGAWYLGWYFANYAFGVDGNQPGSYNFSGGAVLLNCSPDGTRHFYTGGAYPAPAGWASAAPTVNSCQFACQVNMQQGITIPAGVTDVWLSKSNSAYPPAGGNRAYYHYKWAAATTAALTFQPGGLSLNLGSMSGPDSVSDPLTQVGDGGDPDHPSNKRNRWRPGPQDWPNVPRHHPGPKPPDQPPPGGTSGGGGSSGGWGGNPEPPPDPGLFWPSLEDGPAPYKVPAHSYSNSDDQWEMENDWHMLVPDYAIKILMQHGIYEKTHWFKSPKGLDDLFKVLAKSIPDHPCVGLTGSARVDCVMKNIGRVSWKHFAGQVGREASKVETPGVVRTPLPNWDRRAKKAFHVVRALHNSIALGQKRSRVFSARKGMS